MQSRSPAGMTRRLRTHRLLPPVKTWRKEESIDEERAQKVPERRSGGSGGDDRRALDCTVRARGGGSPRCGAARPVRLPRHLRNLLQRSLQSRGGGDERRRRATGHAGPGDDLRHAVEQPALCAVRAASRDAGQGACRARRDHERVARGHPAHPEAVQHALLLQLQLRRRRVRPQHLPGRHRARAQRAGAHRLRGREHRQVDVHDRGRLQLRADHLRVGQEVRAGARRIGPVGGLLPARRHPVRIGDQQDPGGQAGHDLVGAGGNRAPGVLSPVGRGRHAERDPPSCRRCSRRARI